jgi:heme-degrading monooxygenase HmoA
VLVVNRFRADRGEAEGQLREGLEDALGLLSRQPGYLEGRIGRNVDDPRLWLLQTRWTGAGAYRRALSSYEVRAGAWQVLGRALDEPSAYELVEPGQPLNQQAPRST